MGASIEELRLVTLRSTKLIPVTSHSAYLNSARLFNLLILLTLNNILLFLVVQPSKHLGKGKEMVPYEQLAIKSKDKC